MRFLHLSDLHIGKRVNETSMLAEQSHILSFVLQQLDLKAVDTVFIAGDVYDKPVPSAEAVEVFDDFLTELAKRELKVFIISGNHDSPERIAFGSEIFSRGGIYTSGTFSGKLKKHTVRDEYGEVEVVLMPFLKPYAVREALGDESIASYNDAVRAALKTAEPFSAERRVVVAHQFVVGAEPSSSENIAVGGVDMIDAALFDGYCYAALGHIHKRQSILRPEVCYPGTLLKYNIGESGQQKVLVFGELDADGRVTTETVDVHPLHDLREVKGKYSELVSAGLNGCGCDDYVYITLTDDDEIPDAVAKLRTVYPNIMQLKYENLRTGGISEASEDKIESLSPEELFADFFSERNGKEMTAEQREIVHNLTEKIWGDEE